MNAIEEKISRLAEGLLLEKGLEMVETICRQTGSRALVRLFISRKGGVSIQDCTDVSRELGTLLDAEDVMPGPFVLEVSSPGLDRPLKTRRDFERNIGNPLQITFHSPEDKVVTFTGKLTETNQDSITINIKGKDQQIGLDSVVSAKQIVII